MKGKPVMLKEPAESRLTRRRVSSTPTQKGETNIWLLDLIPHKRSAKESWPAWRRPRIKQPDGFNANKKKDRPVKAVLPWVKLKFGIPILNRNCRRAVPRSLGI
jgi:hypothetical protein